MSGAADITTSDSLAELAAGDDDPLAPEAPLQPAAGAVKFTEDQARAWLSENGNAAKSIRELAAIWGWHRSSGSRFLSRNRGETKPETARQQAR